MHCLEGARKHAPLSAFFLDIQKAYDTVWHDGPMFKLLRKGVTGRLGRVVSQLFPQVTVKSVH